jgi:hypothetical protein
LTKPEALAYVDKLKQAAAELRQLAKIVGYASAVTYGVRHAISLPELAKAFPALARLAPYLLVAAAAGALLALDLNLSAEQVEEFAAEVSKVVNNSGSGVILSYTCSVLVCYQTLVDRDTGNGIEYSTSGHITEGVIWQSVGARDQHLLLPGGACTRSGGDPSNGNFYGGDVALCSNFYHSF